MAKRILLVDDSVLLGDAIKRTLNRTAYQCQIINNGIAALELVSLQRFSAVITDLKMPGMSGEELVERLNGVQPGLPVIVLTGNATRQAIVRLRKSPNVKAILIKPWDPSRVLAELDAVTAEPEAAEAAAPARTH